MTCFLDRFRIGVAFALASLSAAGSAAADDLLSAYDLALDSLITGSISKSRPLVMTESGQYCVNIADAAADARYAWQVETLAMMEQRIEERIALLENQQRDYAEWIQRRDEYLSKAEQNVVDIYAKMRPEAAAEQLSLLDYETAAVILSKLNTRKASTILNEIAPAQAARLTRTMVTVTRPPKPAATDAGAAIPAQSRAGRREGT